MNMISADNAAVLAVKSIAAAKPAAAAGVAAAGDSAGAFGSMADTRNKAAVGDSAGDNAQLMAILAGIQQSSRDTAKALAQLAGRQTPRCGCCCGGDNATSTIGYNTAYVVSKEYIENGVWKSGLVSYRNPIRSQAEADKVDVIVFLGGNFDPRQEITLDGFTLRGAFPIDLQCVNSYPCTFLRKQDESGWISLTRPDIINIDSNTVNVMVNADLITDSYPDNDIQRQLCCGLYEHNCRGKIFYAAIADARQPERWIEEKKKQAVSFTLKRDTVFYDIFPENPAPSYQYVSIQVSGSFLSGGRYDGYTWGDFIEEFGDRPFGVIIPADGCLLGQAFALN